ncbi:hypothetical protein [Fredinandcohnia quinoae]|uniref:Uncharacterized protein n=1 Tax=Fredinandcohnia quinoae TaxID=2918902 RepID=A0AAW5E8I2_9BACI|nr:hypothetical protein [Fredinandcohnia sp. SECRCQ15]MCH1626331.1 hypothetical protein [Fredinandcohnia sp. SECRCQ15]
MRSKETVELALNMEFDITNKFIPNMCEAKTLRVIDINSSSVRIEMENARTRGVFPLSHFQSLIRQGALILSTDKLEKEDTA